MLETMRTIIAEQLGVDEKSIHMDTSFKDDLGADSLDIFELIMALEETYDMETSAEELAEMSTVGDVVNYLKSQGIDA